MLGALVGVLVEGGVLAGEPLAAEEVGCEVAADPGAADEGFPVATGALVSVATGAIVSVATGAVVSGAMVVWSEPFPQQPSASMDWYSAHV